VIDTLWQVYCDGAWGVSGAGAAAILISPLGIRYTVRLQFTTETDKCSNNIAEYKAVSLGLRKLRAMGVQNCILKIDSKVIMGQTEKKCMARDATLERYKATVRRMDNYFKGFTIEFVERTKNTEANELAEATDRKTVLQLDVFFQTIETPP
jgi:ribonuclease HI